MHLVFVFLTENVDILHFAIKSRHWKQLHSREFGIMYVVGIGFYKLVVPLTHFDHFGT